MAKSFNAQMQARFTKITNDYDKTNKYVHETAMLIAAHAEEHKDCSTAQGLVMAMPASIRREMLILWFSKFTPIVVKNDENWVAKMHKEGTKLFVPFDLEAGNLKPFYELAKENPEKAPLDFQALVKLVEGLAKRIGTMAEEGKVLEEDIPSAEAIVKQLSSLKIKRVNPANGNEDNSAAETRTGTEG